jgi:hypothetical protein
MEIFMRGTNRTTPSGEHEAMLAMLMRTLVEARNKMAQARDNLQSLDPGLKSQGRGDLDKKREKALIEYREAMGQARQARTRLLKQLREQAA